MLSPLVTNKYSVQWDFVLCSGCRLSVSTKVSCVRRLHPVWWCWGVEKSLRDRAWWEAIGQGHPQKGLLLASCSDSLHKNWVNLAPPQHLASHLIMWSSLLAYIPIMMLSVMLHSSKKSLIRKKFPILDFRSPKLQVNTPLSGKCPASGPCYSNPNLMSWKYTLQSPSLATLAS